MGKLSYFLVSVTKVYKIKDCEELLAAYAKWKDAPLNLDGARAANGIEKHSPREWCVSAAFTNSPR